MPFGKYADFDACVKANRDKDDPQAYCAALMRMIEGVPVKAKPAPKRKDSGR